MSALLTVASTLALVCALLLAVSIALPPTKFFCWQDVPGTLSDPQEFYIGLYAFQQTKTWPAGIAFHHGKAGGPVHAPFDASIYSMRSVDRKFCEANPAAFPFETQNCGKWKRLQLASFIMLISGCSAVKLLLTGALYGQWLGKQSIFSVQLCYLLAAMIGLSGLVTYFILTRDLFSDRGINLSQGFWLAMVVCLLTPISAMLLACRKPKHDLHLYDDGQARRTRSGFSPWALAFVP